MGWYDQIKQYDPGFYLEKYKYKTGKRIVSYALQKTVFKKTPAGYNKFRKTCSGWLIYDKYHNTAKNPC